MRPYSPETLAERGVERGERGERGGERGVERGERGEERGVGALRRQAHRADGGGMTEAEITGAMERLHINRYEAETVKYIGEGVYASCDGYQVWLRTLEGNRIALGRRELDDLNRYADDMLMG